MTSALRGGPSERGVSERVSAAYRRIAEVDRPEVWITLRPEAELQAEAAVLEARLAAGESLPLAGVLVAVKDNVDVAGLPTTAASPSFAYDPAVSAPAVQRLVDTGALVLGKTNLDQFATGLVGTRSPYGVVRNAFDPELISGGSSSGSAVAVALGLADIGIGTDTAGSGRVPAAFNGIVGLKPTLGLVSNTGVVPAVRPFDTISVFARTLTEAQAALTVMTAPDPADPTSRPWPATVTLAGSPARRIAVPDEDGLAAAAPQMRAAVTDAAAVLEKAGYTIETVSISVLLDAASLLYGSALVSERYAAVGDFISAHREDADPTVAKLILSARSYVAHELARAQDEVRRYRVEAKRLLTGFDALLLPTTTSHPSIADVRADPIETNIRLGTYTNFVNLLDMAAVAVPVPSAGWSAGVSVIGVAFTDQVLLDVAAAITGEVLTASYAPTDTRLVVFGAHMRGEPLNHQLSDLGARYLDEVHTAPRYRMVALPTVPPKPGILHDPADGGVLAGERWAISPAGLGAFLAALPDPMRLGVVHLDDGATAVGFHCDPVAAVGAQDITELGSWRAYLSRR
ncbi:MAG TPA: allophanate hydrolase [Jatrophihabitans sp.]